MCPAWAPHSIRRGGAVREEAGKGAGGNVNAESGGHQAVLGGPCTLGASTHGAGRFGESYYIAFTVGGPLDLEARPMAARGPTRPVRRRGALGVAGSAARRDV